MDRAFRLCKFSSLIYSQNSNLTVNWLSSEVLGSYSRSNPLSWQNCWPSGRSFSISVFTMQSHFPDGNFQAPLWQKPETKITRLKRISVPFRMLTIWRLLSGHSQTMLVRQGRYLGGTGDVNNIQIFPYFRNFRKFPHKCKQEVDKWSIMDKIFST